MESSNKINSDEIKLRTEIELTEDNETGPLNKDSNDEPEDSPQCSQSVSSIVIEAKEQWQQKTETANNSKDQANNDEEEKRLVYLSNFSEAALAAYIKELNTEIYELGLREARELSRSKHLRVFSNTRRRANKRE